MTFLFRRVSARSIAPPATRRSSGGRVIGCAANWGRILLLMGTLPALAQPAPKINSVFPEWLQRGGEVEVTFQGENLSEVQEVLFSGEPGFSGTVVRPATQAVNVDSPGNSFSVVPPTPDDKRVKVRIQVEAGRSVSPREARLASGAGVSNPVTLHVVDAPWVPEREPNNDREAAQRIELPAAIAGRMQVAADVDVFRFEAQKGERLVFDVHASRGGSPLDSSLALWDAEGRELARSEDANLLDSLIRFEVPEDGVYFLELRDFQFRGGGGYKYHLMAGAIPYVDRIFPPGGAVGDEVKLSLTGDNLEGAESLTLRIAEDAKPGIEEFRALTEKGAANPVSFHVGVHEETMEQEPNDTREQAGALKWPVTVNGRMGSAGDVDWFKFAVIQGDGLVFEALANRLGSPLDVLLTLTDAQGTVLARNDDASGMDARLAHT
ncbi:MAG TPA: pre-peptidase C-terminal domain-containing protein, partial [Methylomirabilota bacterium]|nr:pre-peptidase C-terminal domain-containing protein [Methylomirabilota bacterium]